jgi:ATP-binding cassette subfamily B protein
VGRVLREIRRESMDKNAQMNARMNETLNVSGALLVKLFGRQRDEMDRFGEHSGDVARIGVRSALVGQWFFLGLGLVGAVGTALVFWIGGHLVLQGTFTVGIIVAFSAYLRQLYGPLGSMSNAHIEFATSMVSFERVFQVLDLPVEISDSPDAVEMETVLGHIVFDDVSFSYAAGGDGGAGSLGLTVERGANGQNGAVPSRAEGRAMAVEHLSFEIRPGQLAALVGPSGAGKTTITYLLPRLYDPTGGRITLDGHDMRDIRSESLSRAIGMVTQETYLFHDTIRANLRYARADATDEDLDNACRAANIHEFIQSLPDGYDTVVGERGYRLSGGEKQRISLARVILKNPSILILDEATSNLDSQSEALIQEALDQILEGRTSLVIAHRLSTILAADLILVMDDGKLVEQAESGPLQSAHEALLAQGGLYATLYRTQFRDGQDVETSVAVPG